MMGWLQNHGWVVGLVVAAALTLAGLALWSARRPPPATPVPGAAARRRVDLTFAAAVLVTLAVGLAVVLWLLGQADQAPAGKDRATLRADAVKTGATIALGTGGAAYLLLAYRRQRLGEVDTRERRITELYTKAVEQLGHEKAPVRLGALYSLERLAQDNPEHRQTVIDVICAYLRMPYTLPAQNELGAEQAKQAAPPADRDGAPHPVPGRDPAQEELQVRQTAQRILAAHLRLASGIFGAAAQRRPPSPRQAFWPGISLDLTGATLVDFDFARVSVLQARFDRATFQGDARFSKAAFQGDAGFDGAIFQGDAGFVEATFQHDAEFVDAAFQRDARFHKAAFQGDAGFVDAAFQRDVWFLEATFQHDARFSGATFRHDVWFSRVTFQGGAGFDGVTFQGTARFGRVSFEYDAEFVRAAFQGDTEFVGADFEGDARFDGATFTSDNGGKGVAGAQVLYLDDPDLNKNDRRVWPDGYTVRPDPADPTRGTVIYAGQAEEPEPAVPPPDRPTDNGLGSG
jgi:uncharacterized protein YjbI with pentapeptide repeats